MVDAGTKIKNDGEYQPKQRLMLILSFVMLLSHFFNIIAQL